MPQVEKLKSGRWKVRYLDPTRTSPRTGKAMWASQSFDMKRDADQFARELALLGTRDALDRLYAGIDQARTPVLDVLAAEHIASLSGIEPGTRLKYERVWGRVWSPLVGTTPANLLTRDAVAAAVNQLEDRYAAKTIRNAHALLSAVCARAVEHGYATSNPAKRTRLPRSRETEAAEMRILTPQEFAELHARINPHYQPFVRFLAGTGTRWGEAVALTVADVQLPNVRIRRAVKWSPDRSAQRTAAPKTRRANRTVTVGQALADDLTAACAGRAGSELVWTAPKGGPIQHRTFWSDIWLPAASLLSPRPRIHDLRHTHASWLLGQGVPIIVVQRRLGHEKSSTTMDTYGHLLPDAQVAAASAAEKALGFLAPTELG